jgi:hypothetical protein
MTNYFTGRMYRLAQGAFCNDIKNHVPLALMNILILELISGILCVVVAAN